MDQALGIQQSSWHSAHTMTVWLFVVLRYLRDVFTLLFAATLCCHTLLLQLYTNRLDSPQQVIIREIKHSEGSLQELAAAGAPTSASSYEDAEAAAAVFSAIAPQCLKSFELHELQLPGCSSSGSDGSSGGGRVGINNALAADAAVA